MELEDGVAGVFGDLSAAASFSFMGVSVCAEEVAMSYTRNDTIRFE